MDFSRYFLLVFNCGCVSFERGIQNQVKDKAMCKIYMLVYRFLIILVSLTTLIFQHSSCSTINIILKQPPAEIQRSVKEEIRKLEKLDYKSPARIGKKIFKSSFNKFPLKLGGIPALYGGYVDYSKETGEISFPRLQKESKIYLVVTPEIELFKVNANTVSHESIIPKKPIKVYLFEIKEFLKKDNTKGYYWNVVESSIPKDGRINVLSIVLLTKPKNIVVPTGDFMTVKTVNMVLPAVYVVGNIGNAHTVLNFLDIRRFFEQIDRKEKLEKEKTIQKIIKNI